MKSVSSLRTGLLGALIAGLLVATSAATAAGPYLRGGVSFALIGDTPYGASQEPMFDRVIDDINASRNVRLVVHSGDVKAGSERCWRPSSTSTWPLWFGSCLVRSASASPGISV